MMEAPLKPEDYKALGDEFRTLQKKYSDLEKEIVLKNTRIDELSNELAGSLQRNTELEGALKQTSFVTASKVGTESQVSVDNAKYRTLLQVMSIPITITETGDYVIYSDPVKKVLEIRKASPRP